ncbi:MAG: hypothetical protein V1769_06575 [Thermoplasmatota archaeon]
MKTKKEIKKGDIIKWQGIRNSDTGNIENGYLWFALVDGGSERKGKKIKGKNRSEAIKNWKLFLK